MPSSEKDQIVEPILKRWRHLAAAPQTISFPNMELLARGCEPSIVKGSGEIRCGSPRSFEYSLSGLPDDVAYTLKQLKRQRDDSYDGLKRFRLVATAADGTEYAAGWTIPSVEIGKPTWTFSGECDGLMTDDASVPASPTGATEVQFIIPRQHRASLFLAHFVTTPRAGGGTDPYYDLHLGDATIRFHFDTKADLLTISTRGSDLLPLTLTENWLGEPLRVLFGQLVFPRLVARRFPKGGAMIRLGRAPTWHRNSDWTGLWSEKDLSGRNWFWQLYSDLLLHVARAGEYEGHKITKLYEEVIQASCGSRWVTALTFASSIEGLIRMLSPRGSKRADADHDAAASLVSHIKTWRDPAKPKEVVNRLKSIATGAIHYATNTTPKHVLTKLCQAGVVTQFQLDAWEKIRNAVMHGDLISPYSSEEDDALLLALVALLHALTREVIRPTAISAPIIGTLSDQ
jgi:hypothetical protein